MRSFEYSFLINGLLPADLVSLVSGISVLKEKTLAYKEDNKALFFALEEMAIIASVKHSNAIEGIVTTDKRIREIIQGNSAPLNSDEQEIAGYRDVLNLIHDRYESLDISQEQILSFHKMMLAYTGSESGGRYKKEDNVILEIDNMGNRRVRFRPISAELTPKAMEQLILAYRVFRCEASIHPLLLIPCFILDFLCIHPFDDGNGRMSRLLSLLLLYKAGYDIGKYISYEEIINTHKWDYYEALRKSSIDFEEGNNTYFPFITNFLSYLINAYHDLDKRIIIVKDKKANKASRIENCIFESIIPLSKREIISYLPDISVTTIEKVLSNLLKEGKIRKVGTYKNARYLKS